MRSVMTKPGGAHIITNVSVRDGAARAPARRWPTTSSPAGPKPVPRSRSIGVGKYDATVVLDGGAWRFAALTITPQ